MIQQPTGTTNASRDIPQSTPNTVRLTDTQCAAAIAAVLHRVDTGRITHTEARDILEHLGLVDPAPPAHDRPRPRRRPDGRS